MSDASASSTSGESGSTASSTGLWSKLKSIVPPASERQKVVPLALMFFCILFNYTILRDTKDVLMITAPKSGAEVIPFIKTYVNLPVAIVGIRVCVCASARCVHVPSSFSHCDGSILLLPGQTGIHWTVQQNVRLDGTQGCLLCLCHTLLDLFCFICSVHLPQPSHAASTRCY
jgi:TLC ATP/ADP transporter